jgi:hypothetical protein
MRYFSLAPVCAFLAFAIVSLLPGEHTAAQQRTLQDQLVGTWSFVNSTGKRPDGSPTWGTNPKGQVIFTTDGRFSLQLMRSDLPKYASNNRLKGTPDELRATVEGLNAYFGRYSVSESDKTLTFHIEGSSFPNWDGTEQKRPIVSLTPDELKYTNPAPSTGGSATELSWRRTK